MKDYDGDLSKISVLNLFKLAAEYQEALRPRTKMENIKKHEQILQESYRFINMEIPLRC